VKRIPVIIAVGVIVAAVGTWAQFGWGSGEGVPPGDWVTINRDHAASRYSPLTQITAENVGSLTEAWRFDTGGGATQVPLVIDGVMYVAGRGRVIAIDGDTGAEVWSHTVPPPGQATPPVVPAAQQQSGQPPVPPPAAGAQQGQGAGPQGGRGGGGRRGGGPGGGGGPAVASISNRGVGFWPGDEEHGPRILFMSGNRLMAVDATTGDSVASFGENGAVTMTPPYGGTPSIYRHVAIVGAATGETPEGPPGNPRAFDVRTGEKLWEFRTVPGPGEPFNETWGDGWENRSGANMWGFAAPIDVERGIAYLPIAGPATNYWGGDRPGDNVFANSIVAVELETGKYLWHFQTVHHDLWDIDLPSAGGLFDFVHDDGRRTPAIAHVGKTSYFFVLNRVTGEPLIPVEERPVPKGDVPTEWYSPTQPFPVRPGPLSRVSFDPEVDLVRPEDTTPEHVEACRIFMERSGGFYNEGPFTPFLYKPKDAPPKSTIQLPGGTGGVNWGGVAVDPTTGLVYVNAQNTSLVGWVEEKPPDVTYSFEAAGSTHPYDRASVDGVGPFFSFQAPVNGYDEEGRARPGGSIPCYRPPWSKLIAVNANTGEIAWESVLGLRESLPEDRQLAGSSGSAGPSVTAGGLVFVGATSDGRFRAFDAKTGDQLWETRVPATANANPMSYAGKSGKQYVAVMAGTTVMVYGLPE
jgi:quinoprotein glucose dehydrogenase